MNEPRDGAKDTERVVFECPACWKTLAARADKVGGKCRCPDCGGLVEIPGLGASNAEASDKAVPTRQEDDYSWPDERTPVSGGEWDRAAQGVRRPRWLKNIVAVLIGAGASFVLRAVFLGLLFMLFFDAEDDVSDVELIVGLFSAFVGGALTGTLVPRLGWLFGGLTQILTFAVAVPILLALSPEFSFPDDLGFVLTETPLLRRLLFVVIAAAIAGGVAEHHRESTRSFLAATFGAVAASIGCAAYAIGGLFYLFLLYLAGKAIFENGEILVGLLIIFVVGPIASALVGGLAMGVVSLAGVIFVAVSSWYAEDTVSSDVGRPDW